jgi:hypothetical protein
LPETTLALIRDGSLQQQESREASGESGDNMTKIPASNKVDKAIRGAFVKGRYTKAGQLSKKTIGKAFSKAFLLKHPNLPKRRN